MSAFERRVVVVLALALLCGCGAPRAHAPLTGTHTARQSDRIARQPDRIAEPSLIPRPRSLRIDPGAFRWPARVRISADDQDRDIARDVQAYLRGEHVATSLIDRAGTAEIVLRSAPRYDARLGEEGYVLRVRPDGITIRANTARGVFYGVQTLAQLSSRSRRILTTPAVTVVDWPAYGWRGIHLDVARHFFTVPVVERVIDLAARYKLNVFHWHLTDDAAWRLASARYPRLGAGGERYSAADVRDVVAYAAHRYVTVVPEIDLPAHATAALRAYPQLACGATLCTTGAGLLFARNVVSDAMSAFPSPFTHVGGDEVPAAARAAQPAFTRALERVVEGRVRRMVGWDDVFTDAVSARTVLTVWTGQRRAAAIARHGNDVVVASGALYFDAAQGDPLQEPPATPHMSTLENVYDDAVAPRDLRPHDAARVLGGQANVWTEHIATPERLWTMTLPRELALAEIVWTPRERKDWTSFMDRLPAHLAWLDAHGFPFRIPNTSFAVAGGPLAFRAIPGHVQSVDAWTTAPRVTIALTVPLTGATIRYTTDGTEPTPRSQRYRGPFAVALTRTGTDVRARAYLRDRAGTVTACVVRRVSTAEMRGHAHDALSWDALVSP